jgi:hypothetical protein
VNKCINTFGMIKRASANSAIASCSLEPRVVARYSKYTERAASTAPPPATTCIDKNLHLRYLYLQIVIKEKKVVLICSVPLEFGLQIGLK